MKQSFKLSLVALSLLAAGAASAQSAGTWMARAGGTGIYPQVTSGNLSPPAFPNTQSDVSNDWQLGGGITYMVTNNWSVDVPLALPFKSTLSGAGAIAGVGSIGTVKSLPATVFGQYRFGDAKAQFRPYLGAGLTYAYFFDEQSTNTLSAISGASAGAPGGAPTTQTTFSVKSKLVPSVQVGATIAVNDRWFIDGVLGYTWLKTTTTLSTGQTQKMTLNPVMVAVAIGYRF